MRYQIVPGFNNMLVAGGVNHDLIVQFADGLWRARIVNFADETGTHTWAAASPDLVHILTTASAMLRTLDTDGLR